MSFLKKQSSFFFELSFIKKYLTPKKKQLSVSIIALLSVVVITLVVWLVILFLSVTEGIEKNWLHKLTALNAPLRLQPTKEYFSSYYYQIDNYSKASGYLSKTLGQKARSILSDPYNPKVDEEIPQRMPKPEYTSSGKLKDPVKEAIFALEELQEKFPKLAFQDLEISGAMLRLELLRGQSGSSFMDTHSQLTNVSYLASFTEKNPILPELILPPQVEDLNHLIFLAQRSGKKEELSTLVSHVDVSKLKTENEFWQRPFDLIPEKVSFFATAYMQNGRVSHIVIPNTPSPKLKSTLMKRD